MGELDIFFFQLYNFTTDNPDKYLALIQSTQIFETLDIQLARFRKVFGQKPISDLPKVFQFFHKKLRKISSQYDQDGVIEGIFELIKTRNKVFVEIGGGSDNDNTFVLREWKGWKGYLFNSGRYFNGQGKSRQFLVNVMVTPR